MPKRQDPEAHGVANGYRSGLESKIAADLAAAGCPVRFEEVKIPFTQPVKPRTYTPDFVLDNGIIVETKGRFLTDDRQKHKLIRAEHPDLDIRFVFSNSRAKLSKGSKTTYGMWCEQYGFTYADKAIPQDWIYQPSEPRRVTALSRLAIPKKRKT